MKTDTHALHPIVIIGKAGLIPAVVDEIKNQLKKKKIIKIKFLPSALQGRDKKEFAKEIANNCNAKIIQQVGFVIVLERTNTLNK